MPSPTEALALLRETLARAQADCEDHNLVRDCSSPQCLALSELEGGAVSLAVLVAELYGALGRAKGYAQEVQRGTDPVSQGDAHGCGQNIEAEANAVLRACEVALAAWAEGVGAPDTTEPQPGG